MEQQLDDSMSGATQSEICLTNQSKLNKSERHQGRPKLVDDTRKAIYIENSYGETASNENQESKLLKDKLSPHSIQKNNTKPVVSFMTSGLTSLSPQPPSHRSKVVANLRKIAKQYTIH